MNAQEGEHFEHFLVPAISGGAGTSINMNMNEIHRQPRPADDGP